MPHLIGVTVVQDLSVERGTIEGPFQVGRRSGKRRVEVIR